MAGERHGHGMLYVNRPLQSLIMPANPLPVTILTCVPFRKFLIDVCIRQGVASYELWRPNITEDRSHQQLHRGECQKSRVSISFLTLSGTNRTVSFCALFFNSSHRVVLLVFNTVVYCILIQIQYCGILRLNTNSIQCYTAS